MIQVRLERSSLQRPFRMYGHRGRTVGNDDIEGDGDGSDVKHHDDGVVDVGKGTWIQ